MRDKSRKGYHKLILWKRFQELLLLVYRLTKKLPNEEKFGLISQMRRAMVSVSNTGMMTILSFLKPKDVKWLTYSDDTSEQ